MSDGYTLDESEQISHYCKFSVCPALKCRTNLGDCVLHLGGTTLGEVESFKYLGVLLHKHLTWSEHISGICNKAKQILGLIYRQFYNHSSPSTVKQLYLSLVRPHLEYACQLWDPYTQNDVNKLRVSPEICLETRFSPLGCRL